MATETSGDPTAANPSATTSSSKGFCFRPSALSDVADKMWKKASADSNTTSTQNASLVSGKVFGSLAPKLGIPYSERFVAIGV